MGAPGSAITVMSFAAASTRPSCESVTSRPRRFCGAGTPFGNTFSASSATSTGGEVHPEAEERLAGGWRARDISGDREIDGDTSRRVSSYSKTSRPRSAVFAPGRPRTTPAERWRASFLLVTRERRIA